MHHDKKICFGLGILLVGIVAALFFRNESGAGAAEQTPQLVDAKSLDEKIADKPVRPYESSSVSRSSRRRPTAVSNHGNAVLAFTYNGFDSDSSDGKFGSVSISQDPPPDPIPPKSQIVQVTQVMDPDHNSAWSVGAGAGFTSKPSPRNISRSRSTHKKMRTYRVKSGDTLTGISQKLLGSYRYYALIYRANRDVLKTPDSVRAGMLLRIPDRKSRSSDRLRQGKPATTRRTANTKTGPPNKPASRTKNSTNRKRRFLPVKRSPFLLGRRNGFVSRYSRKGMAVSPSSPRRGSSATPDRRSSNPVTILPPPSGKPSKAGQRKPRTYVVKKGDSLERIARKYYGTRRAANRIFAANRDRLKSRNRLRPGMRLVLP